MVFSGLEDILENLREEYDQRFQASAVDQRTAANLQDYRSEPSSNSDIDQEDFDECVKIQENKQGHSPRKRRGVKEQLAEYAGSVKSVKVVDVSASDINENFLSNIALLRRLSTFKHSKGARKSSPGAPDVQLCSTIEPKVDIFGESAAKLSNIRPHVPSIGLQDIAIKDIAIRGDRLLAGSDSRSSQQFDRFQPSYLYLQSAEAKPVKATNVPLAKIDLTLDNLDQPLVSSQLMRREQRKQASNQASMDQSIDTKRADKRPRGTSDKENNR